MKNKNFGVIFSFIFILLFAVSVLAEEITTQTEPVAPAADSSITTPAVDNTASSKNETALVNQTTNISSSLPPVPIVVSITANPSAGVAPLAVQFIAAAAGQEPQTYSWDFNMDGTVDSTKQNPTTTFENPGEYNITVTVTDSTGKIGNKVVPITVTAFDSKLNISSYFPDSVTKGENKITFIFINNGERTVEDITGKIVGTGVQQLSSTSINRLKPGEEDSVTITVNVLQSGVKNIVLKVLDKSFPISFQVVQEIEYNKADLQSNYDLLRQKMAEQEAIYSDKKSQNYLVSEVFESIKIVKKQLQDVQEQLLTDKLAGAKVSLDLTSTAIDDITRDLENSTKVKLTLLQWIKENAVAIAAIIAALGTIGGFLANSLRKAKTHATKLGETVKQTFEKKKSEAAPALSGEQKLSEQQQPAAMEAPAAETKKAASSMDMALEGKGHKYKKAAKKKAKAKKSIQKKEDSPVVEKSEESSEEA